MADPWTPRTGDVVGRLVWHTGGGDALAALSQPRYLGLLCGGLTTLVLVLPDRRRRDEEEAADLLEPYPDAREAAPLSVR